MKKTIATFVAVLAFAGLSHAGDYSAKMTVDKGPAPEIIPPCFNAGELQFGAFYSYNYIDGGQLDGESEHGGGIDISYFFTRHIGVRVAGNWFDSGSAIHNVSGSIVARLPIESFDKVCLAPYFFGGGGVITNGHTAGIAHAGAGLEIRCRQSPLSFFVEGVYQWIDDYSFGDPEGHGFDDKGNLVSGRAGIRLTF